MSDKYKEILESALIKSIVTAESKNELVHGQNPLEKALSNYGIEHLRNLLIDSRVPEWAVSSMVNNSHIDDMKNLLINIYDLVHEKALIYLTNDLEDIVSKQLVSYLKSDRTDCNRQVIEFLVNYSDICIKVFKLENAGVEKHPIFQNEGFLFMRSRLLAPGSFQKIVLSTDRSSAGRRELLKSSTVEGVSILSYLLKYPEWFNTPLGSSCSLYKKPIWVSDGKSSNVPVEVNKMHAALANNPLILFKKKEQVADRQKYVNEVSDVLLSIRSAVNSFNSLRSDTDRDLDYSFLFDPRILTSFAPNPMYTNNSCMFYVFNHALEAGLSPVQLLTSNLQHSASMQLKLFANMDYFKNTIKPSLESIDCSNGNDVRKAYAVAHTADVLAKIWDKSTGLSMAKDAKAAFLKTLLSYLNMSKSNDIEDVIQFVTSGLGGVSQGLKEEMYKVSSEASFNTIENLSDNEPADLEMKLY